MHVSRRKIRRLVFGVGIATALGVGSIYLILTSTWATTQVRTEMADLLSARFGAIVQIEELTITLVPRLFVEGKGLSLVRRDSPDEPPFLTVAHFRAGGSALQLLRRRLRAVTVTGMTLRIQRGAASNASAALGRTRDLQIENLQVLDSVLTILPRDNRKLPLEFELQRVTLRNFSFDRPTAYHADLVNPIPRGQIHGQGLIGPFETRELGSTPISGAYQLRDADLGTINGIRGTLSSDGQFEGQLDRIRVSGKTDTPGFGLDLTDARLPLTTSFDAVVDGTNGDTELTRVDATLGQTVIAAVGSVAGDIETKGRTIRLTVTIDDGRFEDLLRLTVKGNEPPMMGAIDLQSSFVLPPGTTSVAERLELDGTFRIDGGQFASDVVQDRVDSLSRRGRGEPDNQRVRGVFSSLGGRVRLAGGVVRLPNFRFAVIGAHVTLGGTYRLRDEVLEFKGALALRAPLSKTTTGFKSFLLKAIDPLFRKQGSGAVLPIKIGGTVDRPSFRLDVGRVLK